MSFCNINCTVTNIFMCFCVFFFADIQNWSAAKRARLQAFLSKDSQSNESNTVDNNGSNEALPTGSDTRDVTDSGARTQNNNLSDTKKVHSCSRLDRLVNIATELETDEESATHIASNASSNNVSEVEHSNENPNELGEIEELKTVPKEEEDAVTATDIASNTSSNNVSKAKRSNENSNELDETKNRLSDQSNADGNDSNQDDDGVHPNKKTSRSNALAKAAALPKNTGSTSATVTNLFGTSSESESETVPKEEEDAVTATDIASNTSSNNVSKAKRSNENSNELDETKNRLSDQSNADGNDSNQDDDGVHPNKKTSRSNALAKAAALPKNTGSTSATVTNLFGTSSESDDDGVHPNQKTSRSNALAKAAALPKNTGSASVTVTNLFGTSSESESAAEEDDGPHDVAIPYPVVNGKWEYIMCDINQVKKYAENTYIELELRIQTCFYRRGQYQGDVLRLRSEFVFVWHFLCYSFNLLCCPF